MCSCDAIPNPHPSTTSRVTIHRRQREAPRACFQPRWSIMSGERHCMLPRIVYQLQLSLTQPSFFMVSQQLHHVLLDLLHLQSYGETLQNTSSQFHPTWGWGLAHPFLLLFLSSFYSLSICKRPKAPASQLRWLARVPFSIRTPLLIYFTKCIVHLRTCHPSQLLHTYICSTPPRLIVRFVCFFLPNVTEATRNQSVALRLACLILLVALSHYYYALLPYVFRNYK